MPSATSRFNGLEQDETGKLMKRRLIGDEELYNQGESGRRKVILPKPYQPKTILMNQRTNTSSLNNSKLK